MRRNAWVLVIVAAASAAGAVGLAAAGPGTPSWQGAAMAHPVAGALGGVAFTALAALGLVARRSAARVR